MLPDGPLTRTLGFAFARIIVPLWIGMGVVFKLNAGAPTTLPQTILAPARDLINHFGHAQELNTYLGVLLYTLIGLEIFAILVMVLLPRLARPMAIFMLASFCAILIGEMVRGAETCGCFGGGVKLEPWKMFTADLILLLGVILFRPRPSTAAMKLWALPILLIAGLGISFGAWKVLHGDDRVQERIDGEEDDLTINPAPRPLPRFWYTQNIESWVGMPWREVELFQFMPRWPANMDEGTRYIVLFSRTCDHCQEMFETDFVFPLDAPVTAIEIPYSTDNLFSDDALFDPGPPHPPAVDELLHLPLGTQWIITPPMALRIEDGIVTCVNEGDHKRCLGLE